MFEKDLISIVIPVYNVDDYIMRCLQTVLCQTYKNLEIILIDDGSTDHSGELCNKIGMDDKRVKVIHKKNGGLSDARNTGIISATGNYIMFIDSDDTVELDLVEYLYNLIKSTKCKMAVCSQNIIFEAKGKIRPQGNGTVKMLTAKQCIEKMLYHDEIDTSAWAKLYDISIFKNIKFPKGKLYEDIGTIYKAFVQSRTIICGFENKYNYYVRNDSLTREKFSIRKYDVIEMTDKMGDDILMTYPDLYKAVLRRKVYARFCLLNNMFNISSEYREKRNDIIKYIQKNSIKIICDSQAPKRDKIAIIALFFSFRLYKFMWLEYKKITQ